LGENARNVPSFERVSSLWGERCHVFGDKRKKSKGGAKEN